MDQTPKTSAESTSLEHLPQIDGPATVPVGQIGEDDAESAAAYQSLMRHRKERRRKKLLRIAIVAGVAVAIVLFNAIRSLLSNGGGSGEITVPTEFVYRDDFSESVSGTGSAKPRRQVAVAADLTGEVESIEVAVGDTVSEGQILMNVKNDSLDKAVDDAWYAYKEAEMAESEKQDVLNNVWYGDNQDAKDRAYIDLMRARTATEEKYKAYEEAVQKAHDRTVRAPFAGTIVSLGDAVVGQPLGSSSPSPGAATTTAPNASTGIQIADLSQMSVTIEVSEIDISMIEVGQHATVTFSALPGVEAEAYVTEIATLSSSGETGFSGGGGVTYTVTLLIEEPDPQLKPGMSASVHIDVQYIPDALCVSTSALMSDDGSTYYLMVRNPETGEFEQRFVTVIAESSTTAVVEGDIAEGDEVQGGSAGVPGGTDGSMDGGGMVMY